MTNYDFRIVNWNIGGAKFFDLASNPEWKESQNENNQQKKPIWREEYRKRLNTALEFIIKQSAQGRIDAITMQEVVQYNEGGDYEDPKNIIDIDLITKLGYFTPMFPFFSSTFLLK